MKVAEFIKNTVDQISFAQKRGRRFKVDFNKLTECLTLITKWEETYNGSTNTSKSKEQGENSTKGSSGSNPKNLPLSSGE